MGSGVRSPAPRRRPSCIVRDAFLLNGSLMLRRADSYLGIYGAIIFSVVFWSTWGHLFYFIGRRFSSSAITAKLMSSVLGSTFRFVVFFLDHFKASDSSEGGLTLHLHRE